VSKNAIVSAELAQKFAAEKDTPYLRWVRGEGLDIISANYVPSLRTVELKPWARRGGNAVFINHEASRTSNDCYVCEIPPGKSLAPMRHLFEEMIFVLDGRGSTTVWNTAGKRITFEWKAGALFGIPLNCWHQHFNGSGQSPVRFVAVTNAPPVINLYEDLDFVFGTDFDFKHRFNGEPDYFAAKPASDGLRLETNFIPDGVNVPVADTSERGSGSRMVRFNLARGAIPGHISQFSVGTYKKAHAHGPGAHVQPGTLIVPPNMWLHQHFNTGPTPARYLAFKLGSQRNAQGVMMCWISKRLGGDQLDYADESPRVRDMFAEALARHGLKPRMDEVYRKELETLPPLPSEEAAE
jgi:mannose-6-phosphate isomerase-like protein (cupin superfamily)